MDDKSINLWRQIDASRRRTKQRPAPPRARPAAPSSQGAGS
jgi:hypothetical protein